MARFEMTISNGEKILVDHEGGGMQDFLDALDENDFLLLSEVKGGSSTPAREVIVASGQITLIRPLGEHSTQSTTFRSKR
jgi:hypothetical protein